MNQNIDVFEKYPIPKAVFKMATPTVAGMIVAVFYNMVDMFFVGQIGDPNQVAAVNVATPVFLFLMALGNIFGVGGTSFLSRALGEKNYEKVSSTSAFSFFAGLAAGILGGALLIIFMTPILRSAGTSENTFAFARDYLFWLSLGGPFVVLFSVYSNLIRGEGSATASMIGSIAGTITNIILDPIFILDSFLGIPCLGLGVRGAAMATVLGNIVSVGYYLVHVIFKSQILTINPKYLKNIKETFFGIITIGLPASLTNILMSLSNIVINKFLVTYGDVSVAGMGIAMKANMLVIFIQLGTGIGISPLVGYNYGSKNYKRMKGIIKFSAMCNIISGMIITAFYFVFTEQIVHMFISGDSELVHRTIEAGIHCLRALMISAPFIGILFVLNFSFQGMGKAIPSLLLAISRQGFVFLPAVIILNSIMGFHGVILAQPIADLFSIILAICFFLILNKEFKKAQA